MRAGHKVGDRVGLAYGGGQRLSDRIEGVAPIQKGHLSSCMGNPGAAAAVARIIADSPSAGRDNPAVSHGSRVRASYTAFKAWVGDDIRRICPDDRPG